MSSRPFNFEQTRNRMNRTVDIAAVLRSIDDAELEFFRLQFDPYSKVKHKGAASVGKALSVLIDAERARREWDAARTQATFDAMMAELPRPSLTEIMFGDHTGYPDR